MNKGNQKKILKEKAAVARLIHELFRTTSISMRLNRTAINSRIYEVALPAFGNLIVKLNEDRSRSEFWEDGRSAMEQARTQGIPVPKVIAIGNTIIPYSYMVYYKMPGLPASKTDLDESHLWKQVGRYAKKINEIQGTGFGHLYQSSSSSHKLTRSSSWKNYMNEEIGRLINKETEAELIKHFSRQEIKAMKALLSPLTKRKIKPRIVHGNLYLNNIIVNKRGAITGIIDWESTLYSHAPYHEIALASLWNTPKARRALLEGYGFTQTDLKKVEKETKPFLLLGYLNMIVMWWMPIGFTYGIEHTVRNIKALIAGTAIWDLKPLIDHSKLPKPRIKRDSALKKFRRVQRT